MEADPCNQLVNIKTGKIRGNNSNGPQKEDDKNLRKDKLIIGPCDLFYCVDDFFAYHKFKYNNKSKRRMYFQNNSEMSHSAFVFSLYARSTEQILTLYIYSTNRG